VLATGQAFLTVPRPAVPRVRNNRVAVKMNQRSLQAGCCFNAGGAQDFSGDAVLQNKQVVLVARCGDGSGKACYRMIDFSRKGIPVWQQGSKARAGLNGDVIERIEISVIDRSNDHGHGPEHCLGPV